MPGTTASERGCHRLRAAAGRWTSPEGSRVAFYARLPGTGEPELIPGLVRADATILDLGCRGGRIGEPLARLGHEVTGRRARGAAGVAIGETYAPGWGLDRPGWFVAHPGDVADQPPERRLMPV